MTGGSTIVDFWRDEPIATDSQPQSDDILLLKQAVMDIDDAPTADDSDTKWMGPASVALVVLAIGWVAFAGWGIVASDVTGTGPAGWSQAIATLAAPLILLGVLYMLLMRNSRTEARRYRDTSRAMRAEADLLELRLGHIVTQLESARRTMQDQAELLDSYGAAASSNMEASAELIASRAQVTAERAEAAEQAGAALIHRMDALIESIPALEERSARIAAQIMDNGHALGERIDTLEARLHTLTELSDDARARMLAATKSLTSQLSQLQEATRASSDEVAGMADIAASRIEATATGARQAMEQSRAQLEDQCAALSQLMENMQDGLARSSEQVRTVLVHDLETTHTAIDERLDAVAQKARQTLSTIDESLTRRADSLTALVAAAQTGIDASSEQALATLARDMDQIEQDLRGRLGAALDQAQEALALTDGRLSFHSDALTDLISRSRAHLDMIGDQTVGGLTEAIGDVEGRLHQINDIVQGQRSLLTSLHDELQDSASAAETRFEALEQSAMARNQRLTEALERLAAETRRIDEALSAGGTTADRLIGNAETLMVALDASVRELDETYPAALDRFDNRMEQSRNLLGSAAPEMERLEAISQALVGRAEEAEALLRGQGARLTEWLESTQGGLEANRDLVNRLRSALDAAHQDATRITEGAGPLLVTALLRVKDTAEQAAERARQALGRAIPDAARQLADASEEAVESVINEKVSAQIAQIAQVADQAVQAAQQASERLTRQLLTIADTSASIDHRIEEARQATEQRDRDHFARRSALLIESLNSTAIDVAKILSNDVTDSAWSAYLKGDRGVFTRRAVKLLDAGESREIALHYDEDAEFRDHVNRYIHDFEAMLRVILSARDGNALGVAILSSDMGKLYVALAQAIERLRQ
ncbi:hypothetical protein [Sphingobium abikonense]|uniref:hypothetical protein n=1 Tax=Sphingobium abikonense TaxID=86193 RepID=UPI003514BC9B